MPRRTIREGSEGATLIEALISVAVFAILVGSVFTIFNIGKMNWNVTLLRHDLQNEGRMTVSTLERDLRSTNFSSVEVVNSMVSGVPRDALCMVGIDNWGVANNFDPKNGLPIWDEYIMYIATNETNRGNSGPLGGVGSGRLAKVVILFDTSPLGPASNGLDPYLSGTTPVPLQFASYYASGLSDIVNKVNANASDGAAAVETAIQGALPVSPLVLHVTVDFISAAFAFSVFKCDPYAGCASSPEPTIGITYKDRKRTNRVGEGTNGVESFQINLNITPQANHSF